MQHFQFSLRPTGNGSDPLLALSENGRTSRREINASRAMTARTPVRRHTARHRARVAYRQIWP